MTLCNHRSDEERPVTPPPLCGAWFTDVSGQTFVCERNPGHEEVSLVTALARPTEHALAPSAEHRAVLESETGWTATVVWISEPAPALVERLRRRQAPRFRR